MSDWIDELVDWQLKQAPAPYRVCRKCYVGWRDNGNACPECGTRVRQRRWWPA